MIGKLKIAAALMIAGGLMIAFGAIAASPALAQGQPGMSWSGRVDDNVIVYIHQDHAQTQDLAGQATTHINTSFWGRLPDRPVYVTLTHWQGRGVVQLIQQPRRDNNFTAAARIRDPQGGRSFYSFTLSWTRDRDGIGRRYRF